MLVNVFVVLFTNSLTVEEHIWFYTSLKGKPNKQAHAECDRMMRETGLYHRSQEFPDQLSGNTCHYYIDLEYCIHPYHAFVPMILQHKFPSHFSLMLLGKMTLYLVYSLTVIICNL